MDGAICLFGCKSPSHSAPFALFMVACHQQHPLIKTLARWRARSRLPAGVIAWSTRRGEALPGQLHKKRSSPGEQLLLSARTLPLFLKNDDNNPGAVKEFWLAGAFA
jgi:hypothetical protein